MCSSSVSNADGSFPKSRHIMCLLGFLGFSIAFAMQVNLSVAIVAMVGSRQENRTSNGTDELQLTKFTWDEPTQGLILGAFFYGYVCTPIIGGRFADVFGGKRIFGYGILLASIFAILTPFAANFNLIALIVARVLMGVGQGVLYPAMNAMLAVWVPPKEQSQLSAFVFTGSNFGTIVSMAVSGALCTVKFLDGWPLPFYVFEGLGLIWFLAWMLLVSDSPETHPRISQEELLYIQSATNRNDDLKETNPIPWKSVLTCLPFWAITITNCGRDYVFYTIETELPTYKHNLLHFNIKSNGLLSCLPNMNTLIFSIIWPILAAKILAKGWISLLTSYKFWNSVSTMGSGLCLVGVALAGDNEVLVLVLLGATGACISGAFCSDVPNLIGLSPQFAGTTYGISNSLSSISGFLAPIITGSIINNSQDIESWRHVFLLAAAIPTVSNLFYLIYAKVEEQPWSIKNRKP